MSKGKKQYDEDFKRKAVDHLIRSRKSRRQVALDLGITDSTLKKWKDTFLSEENSPQKSTLEDENLRLKREVAELREERDILKKSVAIFLKPRK
jgi:transposase